MSHTAAGHRAACHRDEAASPGPLSLLPRPQSAHPSLYTDLSGHLSPGYTEANRRSSLSGPCHLSSSPSPQPPASPSAPGGHYTNYLSPEYGAGAEPHLVPVHSEEDIPGLSAVEAGDLEPEPNSEMWQDIVRQLAVS